MPLILSHPIFNLILYSILFYPLLYPLLSSPLHSFPLLLFSPLLLSSPLLLFSTSPLLLSSFPLLLFSSLIISYTLKVLKEACHAALSCVTSMPLAYGSTVLTTEDKIKVLKELAERHEFLSKLINRW